MRANWLKNSGVQLIEGDLANLDSVKTAPDGADAVFLAAPNTPSQIDWYDNFFDIANASYHAHVVKILGFIPICVAGGSRKGFLNRHFCDSQWQTVGGLPWPHQFYFGRQRWAPRGTRLKAPKDLRTTSADIFGAICPQRGVGAALVLPRCNTQGMQWHLDEISSQVTPGAHTVLILDQAGGHTTEKLAVPSNITLLPLPPRAPELNPAENIWLFMRDNWLSNRVFKSYEDIVALSGEAWNKLVDQLWKIMSIGHRKWANEFGLMQLGISHNLTPRKCLGYKTPYQAILKELGIEAKLSFRSNVALRVGIHPPEHRTQSRLPEN